MSSSKALPKPDRQLAGKAQKVYWLLQEAFGLPEWRQPLSALDELVSTILSQNTNDINRDTAFNRLKESSPELGSRARRAA